MSTGSTHNRAAGRFERLLVALAGIALAVAIGALLDAGSAPAQTLQEKFDDTQSKLNDAKQKEGVLTTQISSYSDRISRLEGEVAALRNREAVVAERLAAKQAELERAQMRLAVLRARLKRAIAMLEQRLVEIYKSGEPDVLTVLLNSDGFDDLVVREEYLQRLEDQDSSIVGQVRELRNEMQRTVDTVKKARDAIARQKQPSWSAPARRSNRARRRSRPRASARSRCWPTSAPSADPRGRPLRHLQADPGAARLGLAAARRADPAGLRHVHLARQRPVVSGLRHALGQHARGRRHRRADRYPDPRGRRRHHRAGRLHRRLRQLHLHRSRRRALHLLRAPGELRPHSAATSLRGL